MSRRTFNGNLSITINDEVTVSISNDQLIFDEPYIASNGLIKRNLDWKNIPIVRYGDTDQNMPRLGGIFLSSAYLMVNHDKDEFTISGIQEQPAAQKLVGIDSASNCIAPVDGGSTALPTTPTSSSSPEDSSNSLPGGAVAGIVVGIIALLTVFAGLAFFLRRRRMVPAPAKNATELEATADGVPIIEKHGSSVAEMYAGQGFVNTYPLELHVQGYTNTYPMELQAQSRPVEAEGVEREYLMGEPRRQG